MQAPTLDHKVKQETPYPEAAPGGGGKGQRQEHEGLEIDGHLLTV